MLRGNKGEWSEPYVLLKLLADGKLHIGDKNFNKIEELFYPIIKVLRHEKDRVLDFSYDDKLVVIVDEDTIIKIPIIEFAKNAKKCFEEISAAKHSKGAFSLIEIEAFLESISVGTLKAKSKLKNDITIQINDPKTFLAPALGFSVKSQLGKASTLVNASGATRFTYKLVGNNLSSKQIDEIESIKAYSDKIKKIREYGSELQFDCVEHEIFKSNLQTIDYNFDKILGELLLLFFSNGKKEIKNTVPNFVDVITDQNPVGYNLNVNSSMYELMMRRFLTDYALGMRAAEVWKREYQATGGYLVVRKDGEIVCYHFYFAQSFEEYLYQNTKFETPDSGKLDFGRIYDEEGVQKIKLNLQIRFTK